MSTTAIDVPHGLYEKGLFNLGRALGDRGEKVIRRMIQDPAFVIRIAEFMKAGGFCSTSNRLYRDIMGKNFELRNCQTSLFSIHHEQTSVF